MTISAILEAAVKLLPFGLQRSFVRKSILLSVALASPMLGTSVLVGFNTLTPLQIYSTSGRYQGDLGPSGASAGAVEDNRIYVVQPNNNGLNSSLFSGLDSEDQTVQSFSIPFLISDEANGLNNTLWVSSYDGTIYNLTLTGQVLSSFSTGFQNTGVAKLGDLLYTTEGDASDGIDVRDTGGKILSTIYTGYASLYGIGIDPSDFTFYVGTFSDVYHFSSTGILLNTLNLPGDSRSPNGAIHDGIEIVDLTALGASTPTPELGTAALLLPILAIAGVLTLWTRIRSLAGKIFGGVLTVVFAAALPQVAVSVTLTGSMNTISVGDSILFTAHGDESVIDDANFTYQFSVAATGTETFRVAKDFYSDNTFTWSPTEQEGLYDIKVVAKSSAGISQSAKETIRVISRVRGTSPVVTATRHPLVALYSAPPCSADKQVRVRFRSLKNSEWQLTPFKKCTGLSVNFLVAGMKPNTSYVLQHDLYSGVFNQPAAPTTFKTGALASDLSTDSDVWVQSAPTSISYPFVWTSSKGTTYDRDNDVVWYAPTVAPGYVYYFMRAISGGTFPAIINRSETVCPQTGQPCADGFFLREYDLVGNLLRETNANQLNESVNELAKTQGKLPMNLKFINHEAYRMPNGYTATLLESEQIADQGRGPQDVFGDVVVVLDQNFQAVWYWSSFDHLDVTRKALLNDTCQPGQLGCPIITNRQSDGHYYLSANDWTHFNSVAYDHRDGSLLVSSRHQSWVLKLAYADGAGDGHVVWRLGYEGDFRLPDGVPESAWFSYQHDAEFAGNGLLTLFDNGNYRISKEGGNSRGQAWKLDEVNLIATPILNVDTGVRSLALGAAQLLSNGNYSFQAGFVNAASSSTLEFDPRGILVSSLQSNATSYRNFRLHDLYATPLR